MIEGVLRPLLILFGEGLVFGAVVGYATRKLNKLIAAFVGLSLIAINLSYFAGVLGFDTTFPLLGQLVDNLLELLPFSMSRVWGLLEPVMRVVTKVPFLVGLVLGGVLGFKLA
jgi:uncharacterized membrane protein (Fun14 family)